MNDCELLIAKYYDDNLPLKRILLTHSRMVAAKAMQCLEDHPELALDAGLVFRGAMLHDIGIYLTHAPSIHCFGQAHYLCHGILGANLLRKEGLIPEARMAERHTGAGLTRSQIIERALPLPQRDFLPETLEEQLVCYADNFFSKSCLDVEKRMEDVVVALQPFGTEGVERFLLWHKLFG